MADNEDATTPAAPEEQSQQESAPSDDAGGRKHNSDSWVIVDDPEKPAETSEEKPAEPEPEPEKPTEPEKSAEPEPEPEPETPAEPEPEPEKPAEPEPEPEKPAEPEAEPEPEKPAEPEPEPEKPAEPEAEPEPEPEKPAEPEPESDKPAEPEPEPEKPAEPEAEEEKPSEEAKPEESEEKKEEEQPAPAEAEKPKDEGVKEEDKPAEQEKPAEVAAAAAPKEGEDKPAEPAATTSGESGESVTVEVTVDVNGTPAPPEEPKEELPEPGAEIHYGQYLRQLKVGSDLLKVKKSKMFPRIYRLEEDLQSISWNSHHKKAIKAKINVSVITEVRNGKNTDSFKASNSTHTPELCFSIIYIDGKDSKALDLVAMTEEDKKAWVEGLKALIREEEDKFSSKIRDRWLKDMFDEADKNGDGTLDLKEVVQMMKSLNVGVSKKVVKNMFKDADTNGDYDGKLSFDEFCSLFKKLASRPELRRLFYLYSSKMEWWTVQDLQRFLQTEQGADNPSIELCTQIIQRYETTAQGKEQNLMSLDGFTQFMLGPESDIFNIDHGEVYQDMSQPLSAYFIASSHNTYLLEDQLKGPSSCEAYINALKRGCRCVELDCWDGPDMEPIIYHGHTLTSKILFKDVVQVIKDYAFQVSQYPVILSIENHCTISQQHRMADIMQEIFGDMLFKAQRDEDSLHLPSPHQLKYKILIKGKKLSKTIEEAEDDDGEVSDEDEAAELDQEELSKIQPQPAEGAAEPSEEQPKAEDKAEPEADKTEEGEKQKEPEAAAAPASEEPPKEEDKPKEEEQPKPEEAEKPKEDEKPKEEGEEEPKKEEQPKEGEQTAAAEAGATAAEGGEKKEGEGEKKEGEGEKKEGEGDKKEGEGEKKEGAEGGSSSLAVPSGSPSKSERVKRVLSFRSRQKKTPAAAPAASARPAKKIKLSYKLSSLINYVQSVHFKGFEGIDDGKCFHMSSFGEGSATKFSSSQASKYVQYNRRQLSRTYPAGTRVTSTNYDPIPMWNAGCQIVALNYQTEGKFMDFNDGRFRSNGRSGYILKPDYMRQELSRFDHTQRNTHIGGLTPKVLTIKVISGQQLPKPGGSKKGEVIDPYVKIQIGGVGEDAQAVKTKTVDDNGFNPVWNEVFQFIIRNPDLALVRIKVMDKDVNQDDFIGSFCLPFTSIVPGYRHIHLTYAGCRDDRIGSATLFVYIQIQDYVAHKGGHKSRTTLRVKKSRDYPEHALVGHQPIDLLFRNVSGPLHRVVDLKEDFAFALLHFKELCGHGGQADVGECVELLAGKVATAKLKLQVTAQKKGESNQVYQAAAMATEEGKSVSVPTSIQQIIEAFNQLNAVAGDILEHAQPLSHELENIYKEAEQMKDGLMSHLKETATPPKRVDQVLDHYCRTMHSLNAESTKAQELKQVVEKELKKIAAGIQSAGLELKSAT